MENLLPCPYYCTYFCYKNHFYINNFILRHHDMEIKNKPLKIAATVNFKRN